MFNKTFGTKFIKPLGIATGLLALAIASCNQEQKTTVAPSEQRHWLTSGTTINAAQVDADIKAFYLKMKNLKNGSSSEAISADDALFLIEGTYNKYVAQRQFDCNVVKHECSVKVPVKADGTLNMKEVSKAFYVIKDSMVAQKGRLGGSEVGVESFDLKIAERPTGEGQLTLSSITIFKIPVPGFPIDMTEWCSDTFHEEPTHVWRAGTQSLPQVPGVTANGQAKIDHATKYLVPGSLNNSLPGAAPSLRAKGIGNYQQFYCKSMMCGYFVNVGNVNSFFSNNTNPVPPEYVSIGIPDYSNTGSWKAEKVYDVGTTDPFNTYKCWLTTPMMNYYLGNIPGIITSNIPSGKTFANFHVWTNAVFVTGQNYTSQTHRYMIFSGDFVATPGGDCMGKLELGYL